MKKKTLCGEIGRTISHPNMVIDLKNQLCEQVETDVYVKSYDLLTSPVSQLTQYQLYPRCLVMFTEIGR
jgi:hypothetical protein